MIEKNNQKRDRDAARYRDQQLAALLAASSFLLFSAYYWAVQIQSVRELLELAYG